MSEIRIDREGGPDDDRTLLRGPSPAPATGMNRTPETDPEHLIAAEAGPGTPGTVAASDDPDVVRDEIVRTRQRMSSTIDEIEAALLRKKEQIEEKLDVTAPVREKVRDNPWLAVGAVFGGALLLGYATGGGDRDDGPDYDRYPVMGGGTVGLGATGEDEEMYDRHWRARARQWEKRARELTRTCARHEEEIRHLRASLTVDEDHDVNVERGPTWLDSVRDAVAGVVGGVFGGGGHEEEYVVELESPRGAYRGEGGQGSYGPPAGYGSQGGAGGQGNFGQSSYGAGGQGDVGGGYGEEEYVVDLERPQDPRGGSYEGDRPHGAF